MEALTNVCVAMQINPDAQEPQFNFNRIVSVFNAVGEDNVHLLYEDIVRGSVFQKSNEERVKSAGVTCDDSSCSFLIASRFQQQDIVFPFLILGATSDGEIFRPLDSSFDPQTGIITLEADARHEQKEVSFIFPTCEGIYYETAQQP